MKILNKIKNALSWCIEMLCSLFKKVIHIIWIFSLENLCSWVSLGFLLLIKGIVSGWKWIWSKTTIDEKAIEAAKETARRAQAVGEELEDVVEAIGEVGDAIAGKEVKKSKDNNKQ